MRISLKVKLLMSFFLLITIPLCILGYQSFNLSSSALQETLESQLMRETDQTAEFIEASLNSAGEYLSLISKNENLAMAAVTSNQDDKSSAFEYLSNIHKHNNSLFEMFVIVDKRGSAVMTNETASYEVDLTDREYVMKALQGKTSQSEVITSKITNELVVAIAEPLKLEGDVVGCIIGSLKFENLTNYAAEVKVGENGYAYMIDRKGLVVYHPREDKILKENLSDTDNTELKVLVEKMKAGETFSGFYTYEGVYKFVCFQPVGSWVIAITANYEEYMSAALDIRKSTIITLSSAIIIAITLAFFIAQKSIISPIRNLQTLMNRAGQGDLTVVSSISTKDEIQDLSESFNQMISHQSNIVDKVRLSSTELAAASEEMAASSEQINATTQTINSSIHEVAEIAEIQNNSIIEFSTVLAQLSGLVLLAQDKALFTKSNADRSSKIAQRGRIKVKETVEAMIMINKSAADTAEILEVLSELSGKIGGIIHTINQIAEQTNLLALNAAIEAARAGEHGKGFTVVADEVRKLSNQSNQGASEIAEMVREMINQTSKAVKSMEYGKGAVENGVKTTGETDEAFMDILQAVEHIASNIVEIVEITKNEVETSDQIVRLIDSVAAGTESTSTSSEEVAASIDEQTGAIETLTATAEEASAMANSLENLVKLFKIKE